MLKRDSYSAILHSELPEWVKQLLVDAEKAGCWTTGIASDKKLRGTAINTAVYGFKETDDGPLAVVQVRECQFRPDRYSKVRKDYYLLGRVESGDVFAHPIESPIRSAIAKTDHEFCVDYVLSKIWNCTIKDLPDIVRQGDVAFVAVKGIPDTAVGLTTAGSEVETIRETHRLTGPIYRDCDGTLYCSRGARLVHTKGEHAPIKAKGGYYRVQPGYRASVWGFSEPTAD
jgi:hypothetical protein